MEEIEVIHLAEGASIRRLPPTPENQATINRIITGRAKWKEEWERKTPDERYEEVVADDRRLYREKGMSEEEIEGNLLAIYGEAKREWQEEWTERLARLAAGDQDEVKVEAGDQTSGG